MIFFNQNNLNVEYFVNVTVKKKVPCEFGERVEQIIIWHMATSFGFVFVCFFLVLFCLFLFFFFLLNLKIRVLRYSPPLKICLLK